MNATTVLMTPAWAARLLESRHRLQRKLRPGWVRVLSDDMRAGRWRDNGDAIRLDCGGYLVDGQHRLAAIVESGVSVKVLLVEGLTDDVLPTIDLGARRSSRDVLAYTCGRSMPPRMGAALALLVRWKDGTWPNAGLGEKAGRRSVSEIVSRLGEFPGLSEVAATEPKPLRPLFAGAASSIAFRWHVAGMPDHADFLEAACSGAMLAPDNPVLSWRRYCSRHPFALVGGGTYPKAREALRIATYVWVAWSEGRALAKLNPAGWDLPPLRTP